MRKKLLLILSILMLLTCTVGCVHGEESVVLQEDGSGTITSVIYFEKEAMDQFAASMELSVEAIVGTENLQTEAVEGEPYYMAQQVQTFTSYEELQELLEGNGHKDVYVSEQGIHYLFVSGVTEETLAFAEASEESGLDLKETVTVRIRIAMPKEIVMTTGVISEDGYSAEFRIEGEDFCRNQDIAVFTEKESEGPVLSGAINKKIYNSARTIQAKDSSGIQKTEYKFKKPESKTYGKYVSFDTALTFTKNGTYSVRAYDNFGNKTTSVFTINDTKKPAVNLKGSMDKKKTYYKNLCLVTVSDNCAVKSVKYYIDGKSVKVDMADVLENGLKAVDSGTHKIVVTDVNGNKRTVTFKVK